MAKLERLASAAVTSTTASAAFRASSRTIVRTIQVLAGAVVNVAFGLNAADVAVPSAEGNFWVGGAGAGDMLFWRGGLVLEPGEQLFVDASSANNASYIINGVSNLP